MDIFRIEIIRDKIVSFLDDVTIQLWRASCRYIRINVHGRGIKPLPTEFCQYAIIHDNVELLRLSDIVPADSFEFAINHSLKCAIYLYEHGCDVYECELAVDSPASEFYNSVMNFHNIINGDEGIVGWDIEFFNIHKCRWTEELLNLIACECDVILLRYLIENGCPISDDIAEHACHNDSADCLAYLHTLGYEGNYYEAAKSDTSECLKFLYDLPLTAKFCLQEIEIAVVNNKYETFIFMLEHKWPITEKLLELVAKHGSIDMMRQILLRVSINGRIYLGSIDIQQDLQISTKTYGCVFVLAFNNYKIMAKWLYNIEWPINEYTLKMAASLSSDKCLRWLIKHGCEWQGIQVAELIKKYNNMCRKLYGYVSGECVDYLNNLVQDDY